MPIYLKYFSILVLNFFFQISIFATQEKTIIVVYGIGGKGDKSFNDSMFRGVQKIRNTMKIKVIEVEPLNQNDAFTQYDKYAKLNNSIVVSLGSENMDSFQKAAKKNPGAKFAFIDVPVTESNVENFVFREQEGSYLVGYLTAIFSKSKKIGFIGGMNIPPIQRFYKGYEQGAKIAVPSIEIIQDFIGNNSNAWLNPSGAKLIARRFYSKGFDVIYAVAGGSNMGVFAAAKETKKYAVGVDINQNSFAPGHVITSMEKRIDNVLVSIAKDFLVNRFKPGVQSMGFREEGIDLSIDEHSHKLLNKELIVEVEKMKQKIIKGEIAIN